MNGSVMSDGLPAHTILTLQDGATALIVAAQNGHVRAVEVLVAAKAQVDIQAIKVRFTACVLKITWLLYRVESQHCTWPVRMVTVELLECCWRPRLT